MLMGERRGRLLGAGCLRSLLRSLLLRNPYEWCRLLVENVCIFHKRATGDDCSRKKASSAAAKLTCPFAVSRRTLSIKAKMHRRGRQPPRLGEQRPEEADLVQPEWPAQGRSSVMRIPCQIYGMEKLSCATHGWLAKSRAWLCRSACPRAVRCPWKVETTTGAWGRGRTRSKAQKA